jgi:ribonucleotide reductase alpha subunit
MDKVVITDEFVSKYKNRKVNWGFNGLGYVVYKRTYSRNVSDTTTEEWPDTIQRCINGAQKIGAQYTRAEAERLFDYMFNLKCNLAGRMLWQLGTDKVERFHANSLINCFFISIRELEDFCFLFENLMMGSGVGFSVRREHIHELPTIRENIKISHFLAKDTDFIVPDSREGWVELLRRVLLAFFFTGKGFTYSTILVRGHGEPIKGFGGTASGPQILIDGIEKIITVFKHREGKKLRSVDVLDICNIIGTIVIAGNIRRSSELALGDADDHLFLKAKRWDSGNIPNWRSASNNTICADDFSYLSDTVWEGYMGTGEPYGLFNLPLSRKYGRLGEKIKDNCEGVNPCAELVLESGESCCLSELYLNNIDSRDELIDCARLLYKTQKAICALPYIHKKTTDIVHRNFRVGVGLTGICQSLNKLEWLDPTYKALRAFDKEWSKQRGWPQSIKLTTCKPSGTLSLLAGSTPGIHPGYSRYYIRRVRMSSHDKLLSRCKELGYTVEYVKNFDGSIDHNTMIVEFPCESGEDAVLAKDMTAVQQLELVKKLQTLWADNAISVTVYYKKDELPAIKQWLSDNYDTAIKSVSFLLHSEHGFTQAPYEEISEEKYLALTQKLKPIQNMIDAGKSTIDFLECVGGACPIK